MSKPDYEYTVRQSANEIAKRVWCTGSSISVDPASIATMQDEYNRLSVLMWVTVYNSLDERQRDNMVFVFGRILSAADFRQFMAEGAKDDARRSLEHRYAEREAALVEREARAQRALDAMDRAIRAQENAIRVSNEAFAANNRQIARIEQLEAELLLSNDRYERLRCKVAQILDES